MHKNHLTGEGSGGNPWGDKSGEENEEGLSFSIFLEGGGGMGRATFLFHLLFWVKKGKDIDSLN